MVLVDDEPALLVCIVSRRTQDGDGRQSSSKVPGGEPGCVSRTTNCCRYLEGALFSGLPVFSNGFITVALCLQVVVLSFTFFSSSLFSNV